jgi:hypothetical protein
MGFLVTSLWSTLVFPADFTMCIQVVEMDFRNLMHDVSHIS